MIKNCSLIKALRAILQNRTFKKQIIPIDDLKEKHQQLREG
jgi:hypothetical protein